MGWLASDQAKRLSIAILFAFALSLVLTLVSGSGADTSAGRLGGDYPAFYAAGRIAGDQGLEHVNDLEYLETAQADLFPSDETGFLTWAYPPHVALAYQPLAALPYRLSYAVHTVLMIGALVAAIVLARPVVPWLRRATLPALAGSLAFYPMFRGIGAGQNTAVTLLLLVVAWRASAAGRDGWAGVALGLLLFKPQFAAVAMAMWVIGGRWRTILPFLGTAAVTWAVTAAFAGTDWVSGYLDDLDAYRATEHVNAANHVSLPEFADALGWPTAVGAAAALAVGAAAAWLWRKQAPPVRPGRALAVAMAALAPALLLCAAHAVFYDVGIVLITAAVGIQLDRPRIVAVLWLAAFIEPLKEVLDANPTTLVLLAWLAAAWTWSREKQPASDATMAV